MDFTTIAQQAKQASLEIADLDTKIKNIALEAIASAFEQNKGIIFDKVYVGNMHMSEGKTQVATYVAVDENDIQTFNELKEKNIEIEIRRLPEIASEDNFKLFK